MLSVTHIQVVRDSHGSDHLYLHTPLPSGIYPYDGHQDFGACLARGSALQYVVNVGLWRGLIVNLLDLTEAMELVKGGRAAQAGDGRHFYKIGTSGVIELEVPSNVGTPAQSQPQIWSIIPAPGLTNVWTLYMDGEHVCDVTCGGPGTTPSIIEGPVAPGVAATAKRLIDEWGDFSDYGRVQSWLV